MFYTLNEKIKNYGIKRNVNNPQLTSLTSQRFALYYGYFDKLKNRIWVSRIKKTINN